MARKEIIVVGGGIGGLTAGALLAQAGCQVTILEAAREWGGCAGKFQRKDFLFPSGATLGMGLEKGGIHERIFRHLGIKVEACKLDSVMRVKAGDQTLTFHADRSRHVQGLQEAFPQHKESIADFYQEIYKKAALIRLLMKELPVLPIKTGKEAFYLLRSLHKKHTVLAPDFLKTVNSLLKKHKLNQCMGFVRFIDGQLIDSMQTTSKDCALLMGALALDIYHEGAYYVQGGLYQFAYQLVEAAERNGAQAILGRRVTSIKKICERYEVTDHRGKVRMADHVICNAPVQSLPGLMDKELFEGLSNRTKRRSSQETWGTMTLYLSLKDTDLPKDFPLFQQLMNPGNSRHDEGNHLFLSLSHPEDRKRAPEGCRTLTISTHINLEGWKTKAQYDENKKRYTEKILRVIRIYYPSIDNAIIELYPGAPKAWERFTLRPSGMVGGFPQTRTHSLFLSLSHRTPLKNFWLCGDSIFPGGGTIGVSVSGYHCFRSITGRRLIQ
ncbi:FAD-dependent oxidoreductase [Jeotgalibacillus proteolyticus]|uniref:FAD-dependent oxidoreductase n=1 Tax=Jeotgalibacillus proteolyticus TaxID=2082395 RepID=A0A2S5GDU8_9BACL|nr:FAD-dependent oxidoreductase [Jeotgalibacillus proteolyticus]PPA71063.1 FAD-dependent oxidoreductase [Jeotgalibacillus proteolyticus]